MYDENELKGQKRMKEYIALGIEKTSSQSLGFHGKFSINTQFIY
jgi:hypothetical protein